MKSIITRIRHINLLIENPVYGTMYRNVLIPLLNGTHTVPNQATVKVNYKDQEYIIRADMPFANPQYAMNGNQLERCSNEIQDLIINLRNKVSLWNQAGMGIFKDLTDTNDLDVALGLTNAFRKQGLAVRGVKITKDGEEVMEYRILADFGNHKFSTTDADEMFVFFGTLAGTFTRSHNRPDPNWYKGLERNDFEF